MPVLSKPRKVLATVRWKRAETKVNQAVKTLSKNGLSFSRTDGIVGNIPKTASKRENRKIQAAASTMGKFQAGFYREKKQFKNDSPVRSAHYEPLKMADYAVVQEKAFKQSKQSMHLRAGLKFTQRTIFDTRLQAKPSRRILGMSAEESQEWAALVESYWRTEKESKDWDETRQNDYAQLSDMAFSSYQNIGEYFAVRRAYFEDSERVTNLSLQLYSPFQIQSPYTYGLSYQFINYRCGDQIVNVSVHDYYETLKKGHYVEGGIEYNGKDQEEAIFICPATWSDPWVKVPIKNSAGFTQVLHGFIQGEPGQKRGIPESAYMYHEYMNARDLELFEMESARLNTVVAGAVTADSNAQPGGRNPMNELGADAGWENLETGVIPLADYEDPGYSVRKVESGGFVLQNFTPGYKYTELSTARPNLNIPEFITLMLEYVYPATNGISESVVRQRFDRSYNGAKGAIDLSWKNGIEYYLKQFTSDWHRPNYSAWLAGKIASAKIAAPGWDDPTARLAWSSMSMITPVKPSMNPLQEAKGSTERMGNGTSNRELESQQATGTSAEDNADRLLMENKKLATAKEPLIPAPKEAPENV